MGSSAPVRDGFRYVDQLGFRNDRNDTNGWSVRLQPHSMVATSAKTCILDVAASSACSARYIPTTSCAPEVSAQPFMSMGWRVGQPVAHAACDQQSIYTLLFLHDVRIRNLTYAVLPGVVWLELAPSLLPCMAEDSTPPQDHIGFCPWARSHVLSHGRIPSSDPAPVLRNLSLMSPCGHVVQTTPDSEVVHDVNWSSITILG